MKVDKDDKFTKYVDTTAISLIYNKVD